MTDETRADLRRLIENLLRRVAFEELHGGSTSLLLKNGWGATVFGSSTLASYCDPDTRRFDSHPPLTPAQQLALSVLLGEEAVLPQALADYLLDQGHEYATECYRRGAEDAPKGVSV